MAEVQYQDTDLEIYNEKRHKVSKKKLTPKEKIISSCSNF